MSRILQCPLCGHVTESFRPRVQLCNHNQEEENLPHMTRQMIPLNDPKREAYIKAWISYHEAADAIDGYIKVPRNAQEVYLVKQAIRSGIDAQTAVLRAHNLTVPADDSDERRLWNEANKTAMRILGKGNDW